MPLPNRPPAGMPRRDRARAVQIHPGATGVVAVAAAAPA